MRINFNLLFSVLFALIIVSCSSDSQSESDKTKETTTIPTPTPIPVVQAKITSYSKNFGNPNDEIIIKGENFPDKLENVFLYFDFVSAKITSISKTEIKFILPTTDNVVPQIKLIIPNTTITNTVVNGYKGNIAILKTNPASSWIVSNSPTINSNIVKIQILDNGAVYYNYVRTTELQGGSTISFDYVERSLDDGKTWEKWAETANIYSTGTVFFATTNDEGWSVYGSSNMYKIPIAGSVRSSLLDPVGGFVHMNADESLNSGTVITLRGKVYTTNDGKTFSNDYNSSAGNDGWLYGSTYLDNNHIWCFGNIAGTVDKVYGYRPYIMYKKGSSEVWKEKFFLEMGKDVAIKDMQFFKDNSGLMLIQTPTNSKILKSNDGGDNWTEIYIGENFSKIAFAEAMHGWAFKGKMIYKTTDGGVTWSLDFTNEEDVLGIAIKNKVIWALSKTKIIKRYL